MRLADVRIVYADFPPVPQFTQAVAVPGQIHFSEFTYRDDFSVQKTIDTYLVRLHLFMHEVCHLWQFQLGYTPSGFFRNKANERNYRLDPKLTLNSYGFEQQCELLSDYYMLKYYGDQAGSLVRNADASNLGVRALKTYDAILVDFLKKPMDRRNLPCNDATQLSCQP